MQAFLISFALKLVLNFLLKHTSLNSLLDIVGKAEELFTSSTEKKDYVKSEVVLKEGSERSSHIYNFIIEAGVLLYKNFK